ncbi:MAG TPA: SRPBCC domain-containing protein [Vicinamibacterales bacterium]|nr:SRPBCC domain-containing protein [Vicinamibacterales bacterium]
MCKTIKQKVRFRAGPEEIYDLLADSKLRSAVTGQKADISRMVGGPFRSDNGRVTGINVDLVPGKRIVQAWRRRDFPEGVFSMAAVTLAPTPGGGTELVLTHRGVPKALIPDTEKHWREVYWARFREWIDHH